MVYGGSNPPRSPDGGVSAVTASPTAQLVGYYEKDIAILADIVRSSAGT